MSTALEYILQRFPTSAPPCTIDFRLDAGAQAQTTDTLATLPKGSIVYGFRCVVTEAFAGGGASARLGFTGKTMLSAVTGVGTLVAGYVLGPDEASDAAVYALTVSDTFDCTVSGASLTAGKMDITIFYHPPNYSAFDSRFKEYVTA